MTGIYNFTINQGSTFSRTITFYTDEARTIPKDMTGYTWDMQIRKSKNNSNYEIELTSENGGIDITNQAVGVIILNISAVNTTALNFIEGVYDLQSTNGAVVVRELEGIVKISKEVTK